MEKFINDYKVVGEKEKASVGITDKGMKFYEVMTIIKKLNLDEKISDELINRIYELSNYDIRKAREDNE